MKNKKIEHIIESEIKKALVPAKKESTGQLSFQKNDQDTLLEKIIKEETLNLLKEFDSYGDFHDSDHEWELCSQVMNNGEKPCTGKQFWQYTKDNSLMGPVYETFGKWYDKGEIAPADFDVILKLDFESRERLNRAWKRYRSGEGDADDQRAVEKHLDQSELAWFALLYGKVSMNPAGSPGGEAVTKVGTTITPETAKRRMPHPRLVKAVKKAMDSLNEYMFENYVIHGSRFVRRRAKIDAPKRRMNTDPGPGDPEQLRGFILYPRFDYDELYKKLFLLQWNYSRL